MKGFLFGVIWLMLAVPALAQRNPTPPAEQKMCSEAAAKFFREDYGNDKKERFNTYTSHFNVKLNRCLISTLTIDDNLHTQAVFVTDVFERVWLAHFIKLVGSEKEDKGQGAAHSLAIGGMVNCDGDEDKFKRLVDALMTN